MIVNISKKATKYYFNVSFDNPHIAILFKSYIGKIQGTEVVKFEGSDIIFRGSNKAVLENCVKEFGIMNPMIPIEYKRNCSAC